MKNKPAKNNEPDLLPGIDQFLEQNNYNIPVEIKNLDELLFKIKAHTGLEIDTIKIIVQTFFQEIRNELFKGNIISLFPLGKFLINDRKKIGKNNFLFNLKLFKTSKKIINDK